MFFSTRNTKRVIWVLILASITTALFFFLHCGFVQQLHENRTQKMFQWSMRSNKLVDYSRSAVGEILAKRRLQLLQFCDGKELLKAGNNSEYETKDHFLYDKKHDFIYCAVEKVGSTFWKRVFRVLSGLMNETDPYKVGSPHNVPYTTLRRMSFDKAYAALRKSRKFVITRDPYSRLFSGYANKLYQINPSYWAIGKRAIHRFRTNATSKSLRCGHDATFEEFIKYVIYTETVDTLNRDGHFIPLTDHCRPCQIKYDIIAKLETLKKDTVFVLNEFNISKISHFRRQMDTMEDNSEVDSIRGTSYDLFSQVNSPSSCVSKGEGFRRTWRSFQYRGYIDKDTKYPLSKTEEDTIDAEGLAQMFKSALEESGEREARLNNRHLVLEEAYSQISLNDLFKLKEIFKTDCGAFGYDCEPKYIFDKTRKPTTDFLNWRTA